MSLESLPEKLRAFSRQYHSTEELAEAGYTKEHTFAHQVTERARAWETRSWRPGGAGLPPEGRMYYLDDGYCPVPLGYGDGLPVREG